MNLAIEKWITGEVYSLDALEKIQKLMKYFSIFKSSDSIRIFTSLVVFHPNRTRWKYKFKMLRSFFRTEEKFFEISIIDEYIQTPIQRRVILKCELKLRKLHSVTLHIKRYSLHMENARHIFSQMCEEFDGMKTYLSDNEKIVYRRNYVSALAKMKAKEEGLVSPDEERAFFILQP